MVFDDIVIGSGLTALATSYGLPENRHVCVIAGHAETQLRWYDQQSGIPCSNLGQGGLGAYWHGVIPMGQPSALYETEINRFSELFSYFYPESLDQRLGSSWLFVPYRPIRPMLYWKQLLQKRKRMQLAYVVAETISQDQGIWTVRSGGSHYRARRIWIAAGALGTPALLERSPGFSGIAQERISDHVILYLGQIDRQRHAHIPTPIVERSRSGVWIKGQYDASGKGLITTKPARFSYKQLDHGIEQRNAFGLPASGLIRKLYTAGSLGLISESMFNKFGLFPDASMLSVYAQVRIQDGYRFDPVQFQLTPDMENIQLGIAQYREQLEWPELSKSRRPDLFIRGIHLHRSLKADVSQKIGVGSPDFNLAVVDPSIVDDIGPEHHSFKAMVHAYSLAKLSSS